MKVESMKSIASCCLMLLSMAVTYGQGITVQSKVLLQGAWASNGMMNNSLATAGLIPSTQPYNTYPWYYNGSEHLGSIPSDMVDWVLVELRNTQNAVVKRRAALLLRNGTVSDTNQSALVFFPGVTPGSYYLVIDHRNHLVVRSAYPFILPNATAWDFRDTLNCPPTGGGLSALTELSGGLFGMMAGDINKDGKVRYSGPGNDRSLILQKIIQVTGSSSLTATITGYYSEDLSMNGIVKYSGPGNDPAVIIQNIVAKTGSTAINGILNTPVPCSPPDIADAGPDSLNINGVNYDLMGNVPINGLGTWSIVSGFGGHISHASLPSTLFTGLQGAAYTLVWAITNPCGTSTDTLQISFAAGPFACGGLLSDSRDGQQYPTVQIGTRCWMARNLNIGAYVYSYYTGIDHSEQTNNGNIEKFCLANNPSLCDTFGGLYSWNEMMEYVASEGAQGICPAGWHIPSDNEWKMLEGTVDSQYGVGDPVWDQNYGYRGADAGARLMEAGNKHWNNQYAPVTGNNLSGFTALPGGDRTYDGWMNGNYGYTGFFWTSTQSAADKAWIRRLDGEFAGVYRVHHHLKNNGFSVRCVYNDTVCYPQPDQANAGPDSLNVPGAAYILQANAPVLGSGNWTLIGGTGSISDSTNPQAVLFGFPNTADTLVWTISSACGSSSDTVIISFAPVQQFVCGNSFIDPRDGQNYPSVQIGSQCWMASNLNTGVFVHSTVMGYAHSDVYNNSVIEKYCYNNDANNCAIYGGLYDWSELMGYALTPGIQGICPPGWHIPTDAEWKELEGNADSLYPVGSATWDTNGARGFNAGGNLKATGSLWTAPNVGAADRFGFTAQPAGYRSPEGNFFEQGLIGDFWTSNRNSIPEPIDHFLYNHTLRIFRNSGNPRYALSVRCLR